MVIAQKEIDDSKNLIEELRTMILAEIRDQNLPVHPRDIQQLETNNYFVGRFVLFKKGNLQHALPLMKNCLMWRNEFHVNDINQASIAPELFTSKVLYPCNKDKNGNVVFVVSVKDHYKDAKLLEKMKKYLVYWGEKLSQDMPHGQYTIIFDLKDAGLSNLDFDLIKYLIQLFKLYYPHTVAHLFIFEMPWILNAAWKIIKAWLPPELVERTKFVDKVSIQEYIDRDCLTEHMGGMIQFTEPPNMLNFKFEDKTDTAETPSAEESLMDSVSITSQPATLTRTSGILGISPTVEFEEPLPGQCSESHIELSNLLDCPVAYKIRTNSVSLFKVRGPNGVIDPHQSVRVPVQMLSFSELQRPGRFQVLALKVDSPAAVDHATVWNPANKEVLTHIVRCVVNKRQVPEVSSAVAPSPLPTPEERPSDIILLCGKIKELETTLLQVEQRGRTQTAVTIACLVAILAVQFQDLWLHPLYSLASYFL